MNLIIRRRSRRRCRWPLLLLNVLLLLLTGTIRMNARHLSHRTGVRLVVAGHLVVMVMMRQTPVHHRRRRRPDELLGRAGRGDQHRPFRSVHRRDVVGGREHAVEALATFALPAQVDHRQGRQHGFVDGFDVLGGVGDGT